MGPEASESRWAVKTGASPYIDHSRVSRLKLIRSGGLPRYGIVLDSQSTMQGGNARVALVRFRTRAFILFHLITEASLSQSEKSEW